MGQSDEFATSIRNEGDPGVRREVWRVSRRAGRPAPRQTAPELGAIVTVEHADSSEETVELTDGVADGSAVETHATEVPHPEAHGDIKPPPARRTPSLEEVDQLQGSYA
jgi:hypothetical protein